MGSRDRQIGSGALIALIILLSSSAPIATDMFLPALPSMPGAFGASEALVNLTLVSYYALMALGMLVIGPLSDKYGRKGPLLVSLILFVAAGALGAAAPSVEALIACRAVQGFGGGGTISISVALVKDCFEGPARERALVAVQAVTMVAPIVAPIMGACVLSFTSWRGTLMLQALIGACALPLALALVEPLVASERTACGMIASMGRLLVVARNRSFIILLAIVSVCSAPFMIYISVVSYIYIDGFGLSALEYSLFFGVGSAFAVVGALTVLPFGRRMGTRRAIAFSLALALASGTSMLLFGTWGAVPFLLCFALYAYACNFIRPLSTAVLLEQQESDTGSASALINFVYTLFGSVAMSFAGLLSGDYIGGLALCMAAAAAVSLVVYGALLRSSVSVKGL